MGDESDALSDWGSDLEGAGEVLESQEMVTNYVLGPIKHNTENINQMKKTYEEAKRGVVGSTITCPSCNGKHIKTTYHKVFCCIRCKDFYWNFTDEKRRYRLHLWKVEIVRRNINR